MLKERREWLGLSQVQMAKRIGTSQPLISRMETSGIVARSNIDKVAECYEMPLSKVEMLASRQPILFVVDDSGPMVETLQLLRKYQEVPGIFEHVKTYVDAWLEDGVTV